MIWAVYLGQVVVFIGMFLPIVSFMGIGVSVWTILFQGDIGVKLLVLAPVFLGLVAMLITALGKNSIAPLFFVSQSILLIAYFIYAYTSIENLKMDMLKQEGDVEFLMGLFVVKVADVKLGYGWALLFAGSLISTATSVYLLTRQENWQEELKAHLFHALSAVGIHNKTSAFVGVMLLGALTFLGYELYGGLKDRKAKEEIAKLLNKQEENLIGLVEKVQTISAGELKNTYASGEAVKPPETKSKALSEEVRALVDDYKDIIGLIEKNISIRGGFCSENPDLTHVDLKIRQYLAKRKQLIARHNIQARELNEELADRIMQGLVKRFKCPDTP